MNDGSARGRRLDPEVFRLPVEKIRSGWYSDAYFNFAKELLEAEGRHAHVQYLGKRRCYVDGTSSMTAYVSSPAGRPMKDYG